MTNTKSIFCLSLFLLSSFGAKAQQSSYDFTGTLNSLFGNLPAEEELQVPVSEAGLRYRTSDSRESCPDLPQRNSQSQVDFTISNIQLPSILLSLSQIRDHVEVIPQNGNRSLVRLRINDLNRIQVPMDNLIPLDPLGNEYIHSIQDPRSKIRNLLDVDNMMAYAADAAYDVVSNDRLINPQVGISPRNGVPHKNLSDRYQVVKIYSDVYTGFKAIAFESKVVGMPKHRIYAIAGTFVFFRPDLRTWAAGLSLGRLGSISDASLELVEDAAQFAASESGGEIFVTGQSQGGILAQNTGFLIQMRLNAELANRSQQQTSRNRNVNPFHFVHIVSLGAVGSVEAIQKIIHSSLGGHRRRIQRDIETHLQNLNPAKHARVMQTWNKIETAWRGLHPSNIPAFIQNQAQRMRVVGYFFQLDLFARSGTFLGTTYLLPYEMAFPRTCDRLQALDIASNIGESRAFIFETHFLNGYRRAMQRGALEFATRANPKKWNWVLQLQRTLDPLSDLWMNTLFLTQAAATDENWTQCLQSQEWFTLQNRSCRQSWHPGCSKVAIDHEVTLPNLWCLIRRR